MTFQDIFRSSFLDNSAAVSPLDMLLAMALALALGLFIFYIYKKSYCGVMYAASFGVTLVALCLITTLLILAVTSNVVLSLGMVGALSIVRFRNAVKDSMDLLYLFWSIGVGIICGARLFEIAVVVSLAVTALIFLLDLVPAAKPPYLLVINSTDAEIDMALNQLLNRYAKGARIKSRNVSKHGVDLILELRTDDGSRLVSACAALPGVESVNLLAHDGEVRY